MSGKVCIDLSWISPESILGKLLRAPLVMIPEGTAFPILQGPLRGRKWIVGSGNHGYWLGWYEREMQRTPVEHIRPGDTVFDVGGHAGYYALLAATRSGPQGRVVVFEPDANNVEHLKANLKINNIQNVQLIESAVSSSPGKLHFQPGKTSSTGRIERTGDLTVDAVSLDDLYARQQIPAPRIIKMDIEGAEVAALNGALILLRETHPTIFLSTHGTEPHQQCCSLLSSLGYSLRPLDKAPLERTSELVATWSA